MSRSFCLFLFVIIVDGARYPPQNASNRSAKGLKVRGDVMENLFNVYDPSFLSLVWPKITNGMHLSVGHFCWEDVSVMFRDLAEGRAWAYNVVDASGRYQAALFSGARYWLGSRRQCLALDSDFSSRETNGTLSEYYDGNYLKEVLQREKYYGTRGQEWKQLSQRDEVIQRVVAADNRPPFRLSYFALRLTVNVTKITMAKSYEVTLGLCLPRSCTTEDVESIVNFSIMINDNLKSNKTIPRIAKVTSLRLLDDQYHIENDTGAIILICFTVLLVLLSLIATLVEFDLIKFRFLRRSRSVSFDLQKYSSADTHSKYIDHVKRQVDWKEADALKLAMYKLDECKEVKGKCVPPTITLDVMSKERATGSCVRCGKYKRQCSNPTETDNLPACPRIKYSSVASLSTEEKKSLLKRLLLCYSLRYSWRRIFNTNMANKDLAVVHLLRIVATMWVIYMHVAVMVNYLAEDAGDVNNHNSVYYILATGTLAFDTLLFVSGLFSSHHFFYLNSHYTVEELVSFGGACGQILQFVCFVTNRIIRLLPSYAFAILISGVLARMSRDTAVLSLPERDDDNCDRYWWRNLLYITNIYPSEERCMAVSWYLSLESQLHVCGALACAAAAVTRSRLVTVTAAVTAGVALLAATAADLGAAYYDYSQYLFGVYGAYSVIIERMWARVVPYFIGIFTGWMVHKTNGRVKVSKMTATCLWFASLVTILVSSFIPWLVSGWLSAWLHVVWPIALIWPTLVCSTNFSSVCRRLLDSGCVCALSRLCYGALVLHGAAGRALLLAADSPLCSHAACVWSYFAGTTLLTLFGALLLSLLVEMPCCSLLRKISDCAS